MGITAWVFVLPWVLLIGATPDSSSDQEWEQALAALRASEGLSASLTDFVHTPSPQYAQYEAIIASNDAPRFRAMVRDDHPVVRCIGLMALAQTEGKDAVPTLRRFLCDANEVGYQVYDIGSSLTVGEFALWLLGNPHALVVEDRPSKSSLLSEAEWIHLGLRTLAEDATVPVHEAAAGSLISRVRRRAPALDLATLRGYAPELQDWQIVKAIGRMKPSKAPRAFLIACAEDQNLDPTARFAAASALTRDTEKQAERALRIYREPLNRLDDKRWGDGFVEMLNARRTHEKRMGPLRRRRFARRPEFTRDRVVGALTCDHPLALDDLTELRGSTAPLLYDEARPIIAASIVAISANLENFSQPWNSYSDTAFKLDLYLRHLRWLRVRLKPQRVGDMPLTELECAKVRRNIEPFIALSPPPWQSGVH